jgi:hypothetical protein
MIDPTPPNECAEILEEWAGLYIVALGTVFFSDPKNIARFEKWRRERSGKTAMPTPPEQADRKEKHQWTGEWRTRYRTRSDR